jgi:Rrf2 family protein
MRDPAKNRHLSRSEATVLKLNSRAEYGLRALVDLSCQYSSGEPVQVKDIARRQEIPEDYLGQLMVALRRSGLVDSTRGPSGGYFLARAPHSVTVAEALETLDRPLLEGDAPSNPVQGVWAEAMQAAISVLRSTTLEQLCERQRTPAPMYYI